MSSHNRVHTGHELSRTRSHEGERGDRPATPSSATLAEQLDGLTFPAGKADILNCARRQRLDHRIVERFELLPDQRYADAADISHALSQLS